MGHLFLALALYLEVLISVDNRCLLFVSWSASTRKGCWGSRDRELRDERNKVNGEDKD